LIELMIVLTIIGILTAISVGSYSRAQMRSRDTTRKTSVLAIQSALEQYKSVNNVYAPNWSSARAGAMCQGNRNAGADFTGLGDCNLVVSLDPSISSYVAAQYAYADPMFNTDNTNAATIAASAYLLPLLSKPKAVTGSFTAAGGFPVWDSSADASAVWRAGAISYRAQQKYYVLRVALENQATPCTEGYNAANTGYFSNPVAAPFNQWRDATYPVNNGNCDNNTYKIFQKSSLSSLH
jgi:Tfp pilus assembly protein PilE